MIVGMDVDASNRYCCSNNAGGYEGYNREDSRKKAVGYMFQPTFAPFWLWRTATTCKCEFLNVINISNFNSQ
jgi:hypothetical protein